MFFPLVRGEAGALPLSRPLAPNHAPHPLHNFQRRVSAWKKVFTWREFDCRFPSVHRIANLEYHPKLAGIISGELVHADEVEMAGRACYRCRFDGHRLFSRRHFGDCRAGGSRPRFAFPCQSASQNIGPPAQRWVTPLNVNIDIIIVFQITRSHFLEGDAYHCFWADPACYLCPGIDL